MKIWEQNRGMSFENSDVCKGENYNLEHAKLDTARIIIRGRYPADESLYDSASDEVVYFASGDGTIKVNGVKQELLPGDIILQQTKELLGVARQR